MTDAVSAVDGASFLETMAAGVAMVTTVDDGETIAVALASLASYSIDPPSVMISLPGEIAHKVSPVFGVSLLAAEQRQLATALWRHPGPAEGFILRGGVPVVRGALAHLICRPSLTVAEAGGWMVLGEATEVAVRDGQPLLWLDGGLNGGSV